MTIKDRQELLAKPVWSYHEVMTYCEVRKSKAFLIIKTCKEKLNGKVLFNEHGVKRNSVLAYLNTSIEEELEIIKRLQQEGETLEV